jgi:hypothetical protein
MSLAAFAPTGGTVTLSATSTSSNVALSLTGSPPSILVTNIGERPAFIALGTTNAVAATIASLAVPANGSVALTVASNTYLAAITLQGVAMLNITSGT